MLVGIKTIKREINSINIRDSKKIRKNFVNPFRIFLKYNNNKSYWIEKTGPKSKMKNQF